VKLSKPPSGPTSLARRCLAGYERDALAPSTLRTTTSLLGVGLALSSLTSASGCALEGGLPQASGGVINTVGSGGAFASGGAATGGTWTGSSGGAASGGASAGGTSAGGVWSGGAGGSSAGGGSAGGASAGGAGTGGAGTGGESSAPATLSPGTCLSDLGGYQNGSVTYYYFDQGTQKVNCEFPELGRNPDRLEFVETNNGENFGAMNTADYDTAATCGACVEVTRDGNRKVVLTIADRCPIESNPKCKPGHIDLSRQAFDQIGNRGNEGYLGTSNGGDVGQISWKYVPCPSGENVHLTLKEPTNAAWNEVLVTGHTYAIEKVEVLVNGSWVAAVRQIYNYWQPPNGKMGTNPYRVRITDVNGSVLEAPLPLAAGAQDTGLQLTCN